MERGPWWATVDGITRVRQDLTMKQHVCACMHAQLLPLCLNIYIYRLSLWAFLVDQLVSNPPAMWETWVQSWVGKIPWRRAWQPTPAFLPGESHGQRSLAGYNLWDCTESDMSERLSTIKLRL